MSETDEEFVADMEWLHSHDREAALTPEKLSRLFALARRGAAAEGEIDRLRAALRKIASNNQQRSNCFCGACIQARAARAALEGRT